MSETDFSYEIKEEIAVLSQARGRISTSLELKHLIDVLGTWAAEAYIQGRTAQ